ncbi:MAG: hypothetical protein K6E98_10120 [Lachnospiraceae bacterium]|nr:hypothetical protein [Lachnospiraceae bacterium]
MIFLAKKYYKKILITCPVLIVLLFIIQAVLLVRFNSLVYTNIGDDKNGSSYLDIVARDDPTSVWLKRDYIYKGKRVNLTGETIDGNLYNNSKDKISDWSLRINIQNDCYINNAWCGTVDIHQYVGTMKENHQLLDLRNYTLEDITLDHNYDGDLLIPLQKGDYIIYYPSTKDNEIPLSRNSQLSIGFIFYYYEPLDLSAHTLNYKYSRTLKDGELFYIILILMIIWSIGLIIYFVSKKIYADARKELELKKSGISSMSDLYDTIYIVDIIKNEILSVVAEDDGSIKHPDNQNADKLLNDMFNLDSVDAYKNLVLDFTDLSTLRDRMEDKNSIACEYLSKNKGWCRLRFSTMDDHNNKNADRVVFTIQNIDAEKREIDAAEEKITKFEIERQKIGTFFESIEDEVMKPLDQTIFLNQRIMELSTDKNIGDMAANARTQAYYSKMLINDILKYNTLEAGLITKKEQEYSFEEVLLESENLLNSIIDNSDIDFSKDIPLSFPGKLFGDKVLIKDVLRILLINSVSHMDKGTIKLSIFTKEYDNKIHILVSVKDNGSKKTLKSEKLRLNLAGGLLELTGSKLIIPYSGEDLNEAYFEVDQIIRSR